MAWIEAGAHTFYTSSGGNRSNVGVVDGRNGNHLRTHANGYYNDNLLALPECR
ncbi:DUF3892 domain-containing protein [Ochrobactrum cytisi]|nr:DUF3892 domain-containing protein [Brucella cytisi]